MQLPVSLLLRLPADQHRNAAAAAGQAGRMCSALACSGWSTKDCTLGHMYRFCTGWAISQALNPSFFLQVTVVQPQPHYISQYVAPLPAYEPMK